jgi:putative ABC transport system permease protein
MLASIGVYGVTAYAVAQRTREIGIRLSLGARPVDIVRSVTRRGMVLVAIGSAIGLALSFAAGQVLARSPMRLAPFDPLIFGGAAALFAAVGAVACYVPVRRATRAGALDALRYE